MRGTGEANYLRPCHGRPRGCQKRVVVICAAGVGQSRCSAHGPLNSTGRPAHHLAACTPDAAAAVLSPALVASDAP